MRSRHKVDEPMEESYAAAVARLEEGLGNLKGIVEGLGDELRYLRRGIVNRLVWAIVMLALALGGKDVLEAFLGA